MTKELLKQLDEIQHYCHNQNNCDNCLFNLKNNYYNDCLFSGIMNADSYTPYKWKIKEFCLKVQALEKEREEKKNV